jgi:hypothetical protein
MTPILAACFVAALYVLHQDLWFWHTARPLVFGFLPIGLFYHAVFTVACSVLMAVLVRGCWPAHLESAGEERGSTGE